MPSCPNSHFCHKLVGSVVIYSLYNVPPIACTVSVFGQILLCITKCPFWFCNRRDEEERAGALL